jgi:AraC-like DNA-binding protein
MAQESPPELARVNNLLKEKMLRLMPEQGTYQTAIEGFRIFRRDGPTSPKNCFSEPVIGIIVQGVKKLSIGSEEYTCNENNCLVAGVDMPSSSYVPSASPEQPFLALTLFLDKLLITRLAAEIPFQPAPGKDSSKGMSSADAEPDVLEAFLRLVELLEDTTRIPVLAPMIIREIHCRLLYGPRGEHLRKLNTIGTQSNQIAQAICWMKDNYKETLYVDKLAQKVNMATSTFHRHFKEVTTLSPLQFHKRLRLFEAQRLMMVNNENVSSAALAVGYESSTQFIREYKRLFGAPPHRYIANMKAH